MKTKWLSIVCAILLAFGCVQIQTVDAAKKQSSKSTKQVKAPVIKLSKKDGFTINGVGLKMTKSKVEKLLGKPAKKEACKENDDCVGFYDYKLKYNQVEINFYNSNHKVNSMSGTTDLSQFQSFLKSFNGPIYETGIDDKPYAFQDGDNTLLFIDIEKNKVHFRVLLHDPNFTRAVEEKWYKKIKKTAIKIPKK